MNILDLKNKHAGEPSFCLGTAPHLNKLNLSLLRNHITIGCNQLALDADKLKINYICFQRDDRFHPLRDKLSPNAQYILAEDILNKNQDWKIKEEIKVISVRCHFTSPGHAEFFSFNLERYACAGSVIALQIQLAVWMGCNPIYILGVDPCVIDEKNIFYRELPGNIDFKMARKYQFPDKNNWLAKTKTFLKARGIHLFNAAGEQSSLTVLPRMRLEAAAGNPLIAVTSKTFCGDSYLVNELQRFFPRIKLNTAKGKLKGKALIDFLADADGMILGTEPFSGEIIKALPYLRFVSKYGVGLDNIDFDAARQNDMEITYRKGVNSHSVAELVLAHSLNLLRKMNQSMIAYQNGNWRKLPGRELAEMTVGIIGYGHVGPVVAEKFAALGVGRLLINDIRDVSVKPPEEKVTLDYLLHNSDLISLHIDRNKNNYHLVDADFLEKMKPDALLINTSRGDVVDATALAAALDAGHLAGAGLDVYENEPTPNPLLQGRPNLLTTCHMAGSSNRAIKNMGWAAIEGLLDLFKMQAM